MNKFNKTAILSLASLLIYGACANAEVTAPGATDSPRAEKTSDEGMVIFRIENIKPIKDKRGNIKQCSYIVTAYNRMNTAIKEAELGFSWQDNITGSYIKRIDDSAKLTQDEISEQLDSELKEMKENAKKEQPKQNVLQFKPINTTVKVFNIGAHAQKSFSDTVDTDKCFLLFDNLNFQVRNCLVDGQKPGDKGNCNNKFQYISSKNPEYYVEFSDVPENVVQEQIEEEKNQELSTINSQYDEVVSSLIKIDETLKNMR